MSLSVPAPFAAQGRQLVALGLAMQDPNTTVQQLLELYQACGIGLPAGRQQVRQKRKDRRQ